MKKLLLMLLVALVLLSLSACKEREKQVTLGDYFPYMDFSSDDIGNPYPPEESDTNLPYAIEASIGPTTSVVDKHWGNSLINYSTGSTCLAETEDKIFHNLNNKNQINVIDKATGKSSSLGYYGKNLNIYDGSLYFIGINNSDNRLYKYDIETCMLTSISPSKIWSDVYWYSFSYEFTISNLIVGDYGMLYNLKLFLEHDGIPCAITFLVHSDFDGNTINWELLSDISSIFTSPSFKYVPIDDSKVFISEATNIDYKTAFIYDVSSQSLTYYESPYPIWNFSTLGNGMYYYTDGYTNELYTHNSETNEQSKSDIIQRHNILPSSVKFILCGNSILFYSFPNFDIGDPSYLLHMIDSDMYYSVPLLDGLSFVNFLSDGSMYAQITDIENNLYYYLVLSPNFDAISILQKAPIS